MVRWLTQDADNAQLRDQLRQAAHLWDERGRPAELLWAGAPFREYRVWREYYPGALSTLEEAFSDAMVSRANRRRRVRRWVVSSVVLALLLVAVVTSILWRESVSEARRAEASKLLALGQIELDRNPTEAVAYALKSLELADTMDGRVFALRALQSGPIALAAPIADSTVMQAHCLDFTPDGEWMAVGGYERTQLRRCDGSPPQRAVRYPAAGTGSIRVSFDPRGRWLVTNKNGDIRLWSLLERKEYFRHQLEKGPSWSWFGNERHFSVTTIGEEVVLRSWPYDGSDPLLIGSLKSPRRRWFIDFDSSGRSVAYPRGRKIFRRSLEDWSRAPELVAEHENAVGPVRFHPNGNYLAAKDMSGEIRLYSLASPFHSLRSFNGWKLPFLEFDPSGSWLVAHGAPERQMTVFLWDLNGPMDAEPLIFQNDAVYCNDVTFDPSGRWLVTAEVNTIAFWPLHRGYSRVFAGHEGEVYDLKFTPDGERLVSVSSDGTVRLWPLTPQGGKGRVVFRGDLGFPHLDVDPAGQTILVSGRSGKVFLVPLGGNTPAIELSGFSSSCIMQPVAFGPRGRFVAAAPHIAPPEEALIRVWDLELETVEVLGPIRSRDEKPSGFGWFHDLEFLPDGRLLSTGNGGLRVWNLEEGTAERVVPADKDGHSLAVSREGSRAFSNFGTMEEGQWKTQLKSVDLRDAEIGRLSSHGEGVREVAFSPTDELIVTGSADGIVRIGPATGEDPHLLFGGEGGIRAVAVSPDGQWIAAACADRTIRLWPTPKDRPFHTIPYEEILGRLSQVTNLRIVESDGSPSGYRTVTDPFPGWETVPEW
jgi:WD40 repeat protein